MFRTQSRSLIVLFALQTLGSFSGLQAQNRFQRGDVSDDGTTDLPDAVRTLNYLFADANQAPDCLKSADVNDNGDIDISDPVSLLNFLFAGGDTPPAPFGECGREPTPDAIPCGTNRCSGGVEIICSDLVAASIEFELNDLC